MLRRRKILVIALVFAIVFSSVLAFAWFRYSDRCTVVRKSCLEHRRAGCSISGDYTIAVGGRPLEASCDMSTDGGGWTLVGNYLHRGGKSTPSAPQSLQNRLPLLSSERLGADEENQRSWGHAGPLLLSQFEFAEVRFNCKTTAHARTLDFEVTSRSCLDYFRSGKGSCFGTSEKLSEYRRNSRALLGNTAQLPHDAMDGWADQGENALAFYPFAVDGRNHWSIGTAQGRWECDDMAPGPQTSTDHQIWIR